MVGQPRRQRLLIISFSPIRKDARVLKQVQHFAQHYDVVTCGYGESPEGVLRHHRIADGHQPQRHLRELLVLRQFKRIYWQNPAVMAARSLLASEPTFDLVLANDIETVGVALALHPTRGVHADIHEYAPRLNEEDRVWKYFVAPHVRWLCRTYLTRARSVTTVGKGIADEYLREFGVTAGVVTNASPAKDLIPTDVRPPIRVVHSGAALRNRGLDKLILAADQCSAPVSLDLYLMPNDLGLLVELKALAENSTRVTIHEPVPQSELVDLLNSYDVGIHVIPPVSFNNAWALPNKFFDYVQARLALVIGPSPEMSRLLHVHGLGAATSGFEVEDIVATLNGLTVDSVASWKGNSHAAASILSAESQVQVWDRAVKQLLQGDEETAGPA